MARDRKTAICLIAIALSSSALYMTSRSDAQSGTRDNPELNTIQVPDASFRKLTIPTVEERYAAVPEGDVMEATITFAGRLDDNRIRKVLSNAGVRPWAIYMYADGMSGTHSVPVRRASFAVLAEARQATGLMQDKSEAKNKARARELRRQLVSARNSSGIDASALAKATLKELRQSRAVARAARSGEPLIYGVKVVGTADQLKALAAIEGVRKVEPGFKVGDKILTPAPELPAEFPTGVTTTEIDAFSDAQLSQALGSEGEGQ